MMTTNEPSSSTAAAPPIGVLLRRLDTLIDEQFERTIGSREASRRQWQLLHILADGAATLDELTTAVAPFMDQSAGGTVMEHLEPLVERGLVATRGGYEVTAAGRRWFDMLKNDVQATRDLMTHGLADGEYDCTIASLQAMIENLEGAA